MMEIVSGAQIVKALGGGHWRGGRGSCRCPVHQGEGASLSVTNKPDRVLVYCFRGCPQGAVIDALRAKGLWPSRDEDGFVAKPKAPLIARPEPGFDADELARMQAARQIWQAALPAKQTAAELYLWSRGINTTRLPPTIRFAPELYNSEARRAFPALIGAIQDGIGHVTAVQRIWVRDKWLTAGGEVVTKSLKAPVKAVKMTMGPMRDGAVRLGKAARTLGIAEGIETGFSAQQIFSLPVWVCCGASRMGSVAVPDVVERIVLFADNGEAGEKAAERATGHYRAQGLGVDIEFPPAEFGDWNSFQAARPGRSA
jgi:putative DNA primase/helicase